MFGAEYTEELSEEERLEAAADASSRFLLWRRRAFIATFLFFLSCASVVPFLAGHSLHSYWNVVGKYLVLLSMALLLGFVYCNALFYEAWQIHRSYKKS
jgi:hypothetical protein